MAYTKVPTVQTGDQWTDTSHNKYLRDNLIASVPDIITAHGQLVVGTGSDTYELLTLGTVGQVLTSDSAETSGMKWASPRAHIGAQYRFTGAQTIANQTTTILNYDTSVYDTDSAVTTGAAWKFTVPASKGGYYWVKASLVMDPTGDWPLFSYVRLSLYKNGVLVTHIAYYTCQAIGTFNIFISGSTVVQLAATDYIDIRSYHSAGGARDTNAGISRIAIARIF